MPAPGSYFRITGIIFLVVFIAGNAFAEVIEHKGFPVDSEGAVSDCVSCHDGITAKNVYTCTKNCGPDTSHPVLKRYPPPGKEREYAPIGLLYARGIRLQDGRIACISCHDLRRNSRRLLVTETNLCPTCHIGK